MYAYIELYWFWKKEHLISLNCSLNILNTCSNSEKELLYSFKRTLRSKNFIRKPFILFFNCSFIKINTLYTEADCRYRVQKGKKNQLILKRIKWFLWFLKYAMIPPWFHSMILSKKLRKICILNSVSLKKIIDFNFHLQSFFTIPINQKTI